MNSLQGPPLLRPVRLIDWKPHMGQGAWVEVRPEIKIESPTISTPINIELGGLPLSLGLFAAGGLAFLVRGSLETGWPKTTALMVGSALGVAGIVNLVLPKKASAPPAAAPPKPMVAPTPPSGIIPTEGSPPGFTPPSAPAFSKTVIQMTSPATDQTVEHTGTFLGFGTPKIPVQLQLYNPTEESVTLNLEFEWDEQPSLIGYSRDIVHSSKGFQLTLAPFEQRNETVDLPMVTGLSTLTTVGLVLYKRRTPQENKYLVLTRTFSIT